MVDEPPRPGFATLSRANPLLTVPSIRVDGEAIYGGPVLELALDEGAWERGEGQGGGGGPSELVCVCGVVGWIGASQESVPDIQMLSDGPVVGHAERARAGAREGERERVHGRGRARPYTPLTLTPQTITP